ncbi:cytochrome oxidase small assembly protein [Burkholderiaceae bacterium UC74_6]
MDKMTEQKKANLRLALILASVVAVFFVGFMAKAALWGF